MGELLRKLKVYGEEFERNNEDTFDLNDLLHPAQAFSHPADVDDLSPKLHPPMSRVLASFELRPFFGSPEAGVFRLISQRRAGCAVMIEQRNRGLLP